MVADVALPACRLRRLSDNCVQYFYILLTVHPNIMIDFFTNLMHKFFILILFYTPVHVSSSIMLISRRTIVLVQHLVPLLYLGECSA